MDTLGPKYISIYYLGTWTLRAAAGVVVVVVYVVAEVGIVVVAIGGKRTDTGTSITAGRAVLVGRPGKW